MNTYGAEVSETLLDRVSLWLKQAALKGENLETIITGTCERLAAAGLPLLRVHLSFSMLHPLYDALGFTWRRGQGVVIEGFRSTDGDGPERFVTSPYFYLLSNNLDYLRRRIDPAIPSEFPVFDDLKAIGATDYLAFVQSFGEAAGQGMVGSWSTDLPEGFSDNVINALLHVQHNLAVAAKMAVLSKLADNMLTTYLGGFAGKRVLSGQIRRGDGETMRAVLVMADMRDSTILAEKQGRQVFIETLNQFFEAIATPFNHHGGEILSFIGDGFVAVFPCGRHREPSEIAARAAMAAVRQATLRVAKLNASRKEQGEREIRYGIGLHVGNVMLGNVGLRERLTFSAFGSAVNEVQRLQGLTKKYRQPIVASKIFTNYCGGDWQPKGLEQLRGVGQKIAVFLPGKGNMTPKPNETIASKIEDSRSEAEQVMLLHQGQRSLAKPDLWQRIGQ